MWGHSAYVRVSAHKPLTCGVALSVSEKKIKTRARLREVGIEPLMRAWVLGSADQLFWLELLTDNVLQSRNNLILLVAGRRRWRGGGGAAARRWCVAGSGGLRVVGNAGWRAGDLGVEDGEDGVVVLFLGRCAEVTGGTAAARTFRSTLRLHKRNMWMVRVMRQVKGRKCGGSWGLRAVTIVRIGRTRWQFAELRRQISSAWGLFLVRKKRELEERSEGSYRAKDGKKSRRLLLAITASNSSLSRARFGERGRRKATSRVMSRWR